jgi:hypothetical protein
MQTLGSPNAHLALQAICLGLHPTRFTQQVGLCKYTYAYEMEGSPINVIQMYTIYVTLLYILLCDMLFY